ncbi:hypothetical protein [Thermospira aquatica]|uniref:Uncharacterized protein n=1 Tax=Thermospira aquatica TaxID=2828656 RepID=A0AAX3BD39_9SPIR|nr:hypothetical protein [Thermospira aquatica]URA10023.1 hypothetical protein KDW03_11155 [Thermospira aquatica]
MMGRKLLFVHGAGLVFVSMLFSNPFPGIEIDDNMPPFVETKEYAYFKEKDNFRGFLWGEERPTVLQKEKAIFFTNVSQDKLILTLFYQEGRKWLPFLRQEITIGYVFENNRLILGYYLVPLQSFDEATNVYERMKVSFVRQYSDRASYSLGYINPPEGDLEGVLAFYRWRTSNTHIELTLERQKILLDRKTRVEKTIPFVIVMSYTDASQDERTFKATDDHP